MAEPAWAVLGGGISGLLAAWHLQRQGLAVEVWEGSGAPGGLAQTLPWPGPGGTSGFLERGPQALLTSRGSAMEDLLAELALPRRRPGPKGPRYLGKAGGLHPSPAGLGGLFRTPGLTLLDKLRILAEPCIPPGGQEDDTLQSFFTRRLGPGFAREALPALVAGVLAAPPERVGMAAMARLRRLEARGGLLWGALAEGPERSVFLQGGTGALAQALGQRLERLCLGCPVTALEALPGGRWRVLGPGRQREVDHVVCALPAEAAAALLQPHAPEAAAGLARLQALDLAVWHSRHAMVPGWEGGMGLLIHPPEGHGLMGVISLSADDPRSAPGLLQLRTYVGGAYPTDPALETWRGLSAELRRWLPMLPDAVQVRVERTPRAFPLLGQGHRGQAEAILAGLPPGLHWLGAARFGPSLKDLAEGTRAWAQDPALHLRQAHRAP